MITVKIYDDNINVKGHADSGPIGHDLVCAAVSVLVHTLIISTNVLTDDKCYYDLESGYANLYIAAENRSRDSEILIRNFIVGIEALTHEYPDNICLEDYRNL